MSEPTKPEAESGLTTRIFNGLYSAIFGGGSFPGLNYGSPGNQEVSQLTPLFNNLRWYFASNWRQQLSEAYCELGLIQTIVDTPVDDAMRGGIEIASKKLSPEQLLQLQDLIDSCDDVNTLGQGLKWMRLFGGGGLIAFTDQDWSLPLDMAALHDQKLEFHAVDLWELYFELQNTDGDEGAIPDNNYEHYSYYGKKVHRSRVIKFKGIVAPSFLRPRLRGWGLSVVEICVRSINQYMKGTNLIYELLDEAKIDVYGIANLTDSLMSPEGQQAVSARVALANRQKNFQHALVMDAEDIYTQKTLTFSGLADVMREVRYQVASDLKMPLTKIFGISASGFNSGEDDLEVYNGMVESTVRSRAKAGAILMFQMRCAQLFGMIPDDLTITFQPLRVLPAEKEQLAKSAKFDRIDKAFASKAITIEEYRSACNKDDLLEIQLDPAAIGELEPQEEEGVDSEQSPDSGDKAAEESSAKDES